MSMSVALVLFYYVYVAQANGAATIYCVALYIIFNFVFHMSMSVALVFFYYLYVAHANGAATI